MSPKKKVEESGTVNEIEEMLKTLSDPSSESPSEESSDESAEDTKDEKKDEEKADEVDDGGEKDDDEKPSDSEEGDKDDVDLDKDEEADADQPDEDDQDEPDEKDKEITDLKGRLDTFEAEKKETEKKEVAATAEKKKEEEEKTSAEELKFEDQDFVGEEDVDDLIHDKDSFNKILNTVYQKGMTDSRKVVGEHILRDIPNIVKANIAILKELSETRETFYKDNPDLKAFPGVVAAVFEEVQAKNPDKDFKDILDEVGKEARGRLDLHKKATEKPVKKGEEPPRLPVKKGARTSKDKPDVSSLESEIGEMNETVKP